MNDWSTTWSWVKNIRVAGHAIDSSQNKLIYYIIHKKKQSKLTSRRLCYEWYEENYVISFRTIFRHILTHSYHSLFVIFFKIKLHLNQFIATIHNFPILPAIKLLKIYSMHARISNNKSHFLVQFKNKLQLTRCD